MNTPTKVQEALHLAATQKKRPPKFGPYRIGGSARRLAERRLTETVRDLVRELEDKLLSLVPDEKKALESSSLVSARTDAEPSPNSADIRRLVRPLTDKYTRRLTGHVDPAMSEAEREQRAAEKR